MPPEQAQKIEGQEQEQAQQQQAQQQAQQQIDWDSDNNPYKKRYGDSQSQVQPLVRTLNQFAEYDHQSKTWKPKTQAVQHQGQDEDVEKLLEGYDPDFRKDLGGYVTRQVQQGINRFREESSFMSEYNSSLTQARSKSLEEFGSEFEYAKNGSFNQNSPLYKMANEILVNKYAQFNPDGSFARYTTPEAEYLSTVEAYAILMKRSKSGQPNTGPLNAIQGKGTKAGGVKKVLSYDEYSKLSDEQKDAYDAQQTGF